jgi:hypothetical protein
LRSDSLESSYRFHLQGSLNLLRPIAKGKMSVGWMMIDMNVSRNIAD